MTWTYGKGQLVGVGADGIAVSIGFETPDLMALWNGKTADAPFSLKR